MDFGEKLLKLRKEKQMSQEALAEKVDTTRQAISKWENGQGYPEAEKLLLLSNIFEVSLDYLLKEHEHSEERKTNGYYVSKEKAEAYITFEQRITKRIGLGIFFFLCSGMPFLYFGGDSPYALLGAGFFFIIGIVILITMMFMERDYEYKPLKENTLIFDTMVIEKLASKYKKKKMMYIIMVIFLPAVIFLGAGIFEFVDSYLEEGTIFVQICFLPLLGLSLSTCIYAVASMEAYELLIYNEEYVNRITTKIMRRIKQMLNKL